MNNPDEIKRKVILQRPFFFFAVILAVVILIFRAFVKEDNFYPGHISHLISEEPQHLAIKGVIISDPSRKQVYFKKVQNFTLRPALVKASKAWSAVYGNINIKYYGDSELEYGDEIVFEAKLKPLSGSPGYRGYLTRKGIYAIAAISEKNTMVVTKRKTLSIRKYVYRLKGLIKSKIEGLFRAPGRGFLLAVLLGERQGISDEWKDVFAKTQTMHLLAISGLHVGLIAFITLSILGLLRIPRDPRFILTICFLIFYAMMVGGRPSVVRATVMAVIISGSYLLRRDADMYNSLGLAASIILLFNPDELFDTGFILSFASVLSIIYITPRLNKILSVDNINMEGYPGRILYYCLSLGSASLAVWLGLLPLISFFFNIISPVSLIVNILAIPLLFVIIALSIAALVFQPIIFFLGALFKESTELFIILLFSFLKFASGLPLAYFEFSIKSLTVILLYYCALFLTLNHINNIAKRTKAC
ncbi:MAG: ComEC/Rec2 family competence protein [Candidatus Omnitrophica bacterium]|nr:ComEC/Rec2 family competence protein [Candidatus Omnitrophota bacterium]